MGVTCTGRACSPRVFSSRVRRPDSPSPHLVQAPAAAEEKAADKPDDGPAPTYTHAEKRQGEREQSVKLLHSCGGPLHHDAIKLTSKWR
jgi:hypothetical protein